MDLSFSTYGMTYEERYKSYSQGNIVPIGIECYQAGDYLENTKRIIVDGSNQKLVSLLWNSAYFLDKNEADKVMQRSKNEYYSWLYNSIDRGL